MDILAKIVAHKIKEVAKRKSCYPIHLLEQSNAFQNTSISFKKYILDKNKNGIIAEFKKKSPSQGFINSHANIENITKGYVNAGASALSVLTDLEFFGGKNGDVIEARKHNSCPILRKDFVIDEYQLIEAKSIGADVILLIAECLEKQQLKQLAETAKNLGLEVLMEVHSSEQLDKLNPFVDAVGVNNRNLKTFDVSIENSLKLIHEIPDTVIKISESGLSKASSVVKLKEVGFQGFLVGTHFMHTDDPAKACADFINEINELQ